MMSQKGPPTGSVPLTPSVLSTCCGLEKENSGSALGVQSFFPSSWLRQPPPSLPCAICGLSLTFTMNSTASGSRGPRPSPSASALRARSSASSSRSVCSMPSHRGWKLSRPEREGQRPER